VDFKFKPPAYISYITACSLAALLVITPLVKGAVQEWAVSLIHLVTIVGMTAFFGRQEPELELEVDQNSC